MDPNKVVRPWVFNKSTRKFDLDRFNPNFWERLHDFVSMARSHGIIVFVSIFDEYPYHPGWKDSSDPWYRGNNVNNAFSIHSDGTFPEFFDLDHREKSTSGKTIKVYQQALLDKAVATLDKLDNVYYEVINEFPEDTTGAGYVDNVYPRQQYWINYLNSKTSRPISCYAMDGSPDIPHGIKYCWDLDAADILEFHFYSSNPDKISEWLHKAQRKGKTLSSSESFDLKQGHVDGITREAWAFFTSGGYYGTYHGAEVNAPHWALFARRMKVLHDLTAKVRWWEMAPVDANGNEFDELISQGPAAGWQVLAKHGSEYIAYFYNDPSNTDVRLSAPAGTYTYEWYNAATGRLLTGGRSISNGVTRIPAPRALGWRGATGAVLIVKALTS
jgi:hypothetical protein